MFSLIPLPYKLLAVALILAGVATASWLSGSNHKQAVMQARIDALVASYQKATIQAQAQADAKQQELAQQMSRIAIKYEQELSDASKQHAADVAAIRAGSLRLRDTRGSCTAPATPATPGVSDGETGCQLSEQVTNDLFDLAADADRDAEQLAACQAVIIEDRR
ncbi:MAG: lysis system i-spanin subunit Rz [Burkholderiales bacterium]